MYPSKIIANLIIILPCITPCLAMENNTTKIPFSILTLVELCQQKFVALATSKNPHDISHSLSIYQQAQKYRTNPGCANFIEQISLRLVHKKKTRDYQQPTKSSLVFELDQANQYLHIISQGKKNTIALNNLPQDGSLFPGRHIESNSPTEHFPDDCTLYYGENLNTLVVRFCKSGRYKQMYTSQPYHILDLKNNECIPCGNYYPDRLFITGNNEVLYFSHCCAGRTKTNVTQYNVSNKKLKTLDIVLEGVIDNYPKIELRDAASVFIQSNNTIKILNFVTQELTPFSNIPNLFPDDFKLHTYCYDDNTLFLLGKKSEIHLLYSVGLGEDFSKNRSLMVDYNFPSWVTKENISLLSPNKLLITPHMDCDTPGKIVSMPKPLLYTLTKKLIATAPTLTRSYLISHIKTLNIGDQQKLIQYFEKYHEFTQRLWMMPPEAKFVTATLKTLKHNSLTTDIEASLVHNNWLEQI